MFGTKHTLSKVALENAVFRGVTVPLASEITCLGVKLTSNLTFTNHVSKVCRNCFFYLRSVGRIRKCPISRSHARLLLNALVLARIDFCSSLLYSLPAKLIKRMTRVIHSATRLVFMKRKSVSVGPLLMELGWMDMEDRLASKIETIVTSVVTGNAPEYLSSLIHPYIPQRELRSATMCLLQPHIPRIEVGRRSFRFARTHVWNALPVEKRQKNCFV